MKATTAWTVDNDLLTPTFEVKRKRIGKRYAANHPRRESAGKAEV